MSYASVASHNAPPASAQPRPDPVNVAEPEFKERPGTTTSENSPPSDSSHGDTGDRSGKEGRADCAEERGLRLWECIQEQFVRPGVAGGLLGVVNVGLLGGLSYQLYMQPHLRTDARVLGGCAAGALVVLGAEGYLAEAYRRTERGREEEDRAREEGAALYKHAKEVVLRPKVFGGLVGVVNLGILGGLSYVAYENWDVPQWDRRTVSAVAAGLLSVWACEGMLAEQYREKEYPKRK